MYGTMQKRIAAAYVAIPVVFAPRDTEFAMPATIWDPFQFLVSTCTSSPGADFS